MKAEEFISQLVESLTMSNPVTDHYERGWVCILCGARCVGSCEDMAHGMGCGYAIAMEASGLAVKVANGSSTIGRAYAETIDEKKGVTMTLDVLRETQRTLPWGKGYGADFDANPQPHKHFSHAVMHVGKALGKLFPISSGKAWTGINPLDHVKYLADVLYCTLRAANEFPAGAVDLVDLIVNQHGSDFDTRPRASVGFMQTLADIATANGQLLTYADELDHGAIVAATIGYEWALAELVLHAFRAAKEYPGGPVDLLAALKARIGEKGVVKKAEPEVLLGISADAVKKLACDHPGCVKPIRFHCKCRRCRSDAGDPGEQFYACAEHFDEVAEHHESIRGRRFET